MELKRLMGENRDGGGWAFYVLPKRGIPLLPQPTDGRGIRMVTPRSPKCIKKRACHVAPCRKNASPKPVLSHRIIRAAIIGLAILAEVRGLLITTRR